MTGTREVRLAQPYSPIGTPAYTGPYNRLRTVLTPRRITEARQAWELIDVRGLSVRQAANALGLSVTTTWRRARWYWDWQLGPVMYGLPLGPPPRQRGTRAVPNGRPCILPLDAHSVLTQLLDAGYTLADIADSHRTVPACIRDMAYSRMLYERADDKTRAFIDAERERFARKRSAASVLGSL